MTTTRETMSPRDAFATWKAIDRRHKLRRWDWHTFHYCYPQTCAVLRRCLRILNIPTGQEGTGRVKRQSR
jgi:hypothetical protein